MVILDSFFNTAKSMSIITMLNCHCRTMAVSTGINTACEPDAKLRVALLAACLHV